MTGEREETPAAVGRHWPVPRWRHCGRTPCTPAALAALRPHPVHTGRGVGALTVEGRG
jgi:hypothetical protein